MKAQIFPYHLLYKHPFTIAHTSRTGTDNAYILLEHQGNFGWGECVFPPYYTENRADFVKWFSLLEWSDGTADLNSWVGSLLLNNPDHVFGIAGIDIAVHNLLGAISQKSVGDTYGIFGSKPNSSYTIGISSDAEMRHKIEESASYATYYKLKVNQSDIQRIISCFQKVSQKPFVVDANQGFTDKKLALDWCGRLADAGVAYIEQPFEKSDLASHAWLKKHSPIPIIADESFQTAFDLAPVADSFDGVNVKLMKCGGLAQAFKCLNAARELGLKTVLGCMSESTVASDAAWELSPLSDWADLDGPLLLKNDPFAAEMSNNQRIGLLQQFSL